MIHHSHLTPHKPQGGLWSIRDNKRINLPPLSVSVYSSILASISRTTLTQKFVNASASAYDSVRYTFPLYDGVSVISFKCKIGSREITGRVKERNQARKEYDEAVSDGRHAALMEELESAADAYTVSVGNVPAGAEVEITLVYVGELPHDAQVNGLRFAIPTHIMPRYGICDAAASFVQPQGSFTVTVDVQAAPGTWVKSVSSPSHPVQVSIGSVSTETLEESQAPSSHKASAKLGLQSASLEKDFVLHVVASSLAEPCAVFARHPTLAGESALMATLVPRFSAPADEAKHEIVFVCDRSGSMSGNSIIGLKNALLVFLKSLPLGCSFNVCSFGSQYSLLWPESRAFTPESFKEAAAAVEKFEANMGGTEMYQPVEAVLTNRNSGSQLEVIVFTDGGIWQQTELFKLVADSVDKSDGAVRVFSLGIGGGVSTALVEGLARAGNGFAQFVGDDEEMDRKVVRMLKGALSQHMRNVQLEVKWKEEDEGFELVDMVDQSLVLDVDEKGSKDPVDLKDGKDKPLYDANAGDSLSKDPVSTGTASVPETLPSLPVPKIIQVPSVLPSLFSFNRTTAYLLFSGATASRIPESVTVRMQTTGGSFSQSIPVTVLEHADDTVHQLAARKATKDLEDGRGWVAHARDSSGALIHDTFSSCFDSITKRECLRLALKYQIAGRYTSFVAVASDGKEVEQEEVEDYDVVSRSRFGRPNQIVLPRARAAPGIRLGGQARMAVARCSAMGQEVRMMSTSRNTTQPAQCAPMSGARMMAVPVAVLADREAGKPREEAARNAKEAAPLDKLRQVIKLGEIDGSWRGSRLLSELLDRRVAADASAEEATAGVLQWLETEMGEFRDVWETLAEKTRTWLSLFVA
ncbi:hypothetical protein TD95_002563 [Thielaviopsis punctulata]|uniref:VIT domain-containing protein n=1 Tax=Thielaviopsis punctulata TaxID=72032 RepID=A0A0F4ZMI2_9PEZI|nr:hypothetical protein TD95_002563 [Thielaviopsis punctulata]